MNRIVQTWIVLCVFVFATTAGAEEDTQQRPSAYPPVALADILDSVSKKTGRVFLTGPHVPADVAAGQLKADDISYESLLIILFNNNLAAVTVDGITNITHAATARQHLVPIVREDDDSIPEYEWVQRVVEVKNGEATRYVAILRPLLPQMAHLVADADSNSLILVGRYGNTKRLISIVREMDERTTPQR